MAEALVSNLFILKLIISKSPILNHLEINSTFTFEKDALVWKLRMGHTDQCYKKFMPSCDCHVSVLGWQTCKVVTLEPVLAPIICWKYSPVPHTLHWGTFVTLLWCLPFRKTCLHLNTIPTSIFCCCLFTLVPMDSTSSKQLTFCWWSPFWIRHMSCRLLAECIVLARQSKICSCVQWVRYGPG